MGKSDFSNSERPELLEQMIQSELEAYLNSNLCLLIKDSRKDKVAGNLPKHEFSNRWKSYSFKIGIGMVMTWNRDPNFNLKEYPALIWHNFAAEIAHERRHKILPQITWRLLQFHHLHNLSQYVMQKWKKVWRG